MRAFAVAITKSSVPRGDQSSNREFDTAMVTARPNHAPPGELAPTSATQNTRPPMKPVSVPAIDLRFTSPSPTPRIFCAPKNKPPTSDSVSKIMYEPQISMNTSAKNNNKNNKNNSAPIGTITNLMSAQR